MSLTQIRISGLSLLEDCTLSFADGLTVISGETGAGKTMVLTSLRLLTGERAEPSIVKLGSKRTEVDGIATVDVTMAAELEESGYAVEDGEVAFSRTIAREGRSRAAVSGRPVPARFLSDTLGQTITIHGQADQLRLKGASAQRSLLDEFGGPEHQDRVVEYRELWNRTQQLKERLQTLEANRDQDIVELRYLTELTGQINNLDLAEDEEERLESAIDRLTNVEELRELIGNVLSALQGTGGATVGAEDLLGTAAEQLRRAERRDGSLATLEERMAGIEVEAQSVVLELHDYLDSLADDPDGLAELHERRAALTDLMRGRATSVADLLIWSAKAHERIVELQSSESDPSTVREMYTRAEEELTQLARSLTARRKELAQTLSKQVDAELAELALRDARFIVAVEPVELGPNGGDSVTMLLQPHPKAPSAPIAQGASGGELSRIMLALEVVLAADATARTFVFDEIDAGIGGTTSAKVGDRLRKLADTQQVIVVTHQPQIAVLADRNIVVSKEDGTASVRSVDGDERTEEIVRMLGGDADSADDPEAARRHALELEKRARVSQSKS